MFHESCFHKSFAMGRQGESSFADHRLENFAVRLGTVLHFSYYGRFEQAGLKLQGSAWRAALKQGL